MPHTGPQLSPKSLDSTTVVGFIDIGIDLSGRFPVYGEQFDQRPRVQEYSDFLALPTVAMWPG